MNLLSSDLVASHLDVLYDEARSQRLARLAQDARESTPAPWRRVLGRGARGLSAAFGAASSRLDPTIDSGRLHDRAPLGA